MGIIFSSSRPAKAILNGQEFQLLKADVDQERGSLDPYLERNPNYAHALDKVTAKLLVAGMHDDFTKSIGHGGQIQAELHEPAAIAYFCGCLESALLGYNSHLGGDITEFTIRVIGERRIQLLGDAA